MCDRHHDDWARAQGDKFSKIVRQNYAPGQPCAVGGCVNKARKRGWCDAHYDRWRSHGDPLGGKPSPSKYTPEQTCSVARCSRRPECQGYCNLHYTSWKKYGDPLRAKHRWRPVKAEWKADNHGYLRKFDPANPAADPRGNVYQHRHVMVQHIGRPLLKGENVHHKNGDRADNRLENLELWGRGQPAGQRVQDLVAYARDILTRYGDLADQML